MGIDVRNANDYTLPTVQRELFRKIPLYSLPLEWNNLGDLKFYQNRFTFKTALLYDLFESLNLAGPWVLFHSFYISCSYLLSFLTCCWCPSPSSSPFPPTLPANRFLFPFVILFKINKNWQTELTHVMLMKTWPWPYIRPLPQPFLLLNDPPLTTIYSPNLGTFLSSPPMLSHQLSPLPLLIPISPRYLEPF